ESLSDAHKSELLSIYENILLILKMNYSGINRFGKAKIS
ncbi:hypothetical protein CY0110_09592, partial [Crocosphaera chwakensis CCY0110]